MIAKSFDVIDQVSGGVFLYPGKRLRPAGAPLVENDDAVKVRVEKPAVRRIGPGARPAVQENHGEAIRVS